MAGPEARGAARGGPCCSCFSGALPRLRGRREAVRDVPREAPPEHVPEGTSLVNGFSVFSEPETLRVEDERHIAAFSLPEEALEHEPAPDAVRVRFQNGDSERMIHNNVPLDSDEMETLWLLRDEARRQGEAFFPSIAAAATRFITEAKGDVQLSLSTMKAANEWRRDFFRDGPVTDTSVAEDMRSGAVYLAGRDSELRPAFVVRPSRLVNASTEEGLNGLIRLLVFCIEYYSRFMFVPGRVENICLLLDLQGLSISQFPRAALLRVSEVLDKQQACRVAKFYVCNASAWIQNCMSVVSRLMSERQRNKLRVLSPEELVAEFAPHQLEEDFGGSMTLAQEFLPFPLPPGPFDSGNLAGPHPAAKPGMHLKLSADELLGHSWGPALCEEYRSPERAGTPACEAGAAVPGAAAEGGVPDWELAHAEAFDFWHPAIEGAAVKQSTFVWNVWTDA